MANLKEKFFDREVLEDFLEFIKYYSLIVLFLVPVIGIPVLIGAWLGQVAYWIAVVVAFVLAIYGIVVWTHWNL